MSGLKELVKKRILRDMIEVVDAKWKILVTDPASLRIISAACKMFDILEGNVTCTKQI